MRRREFITLLGVAGACPLTARAQQPERLRRIGVLNGTAENGLEWQPQMAVLREGLAKFGWTDGGNLRLDIRFGGGDPDRIRVSTAELVSLAPDVIVTTSLATTRAVQRQTQTIPIVFAGVGDPIVNGIVTSIARPEGNATGFVTSPASIGGKWLELLKEVAPNITRVAVLFNPDTNANSSFFPSIEAAAPVLAVRTIRTPIRNALETVRALDAFAAEPNGGLLVIPATSAAAALLETMLQLAKQHRLPSIHANRIEVASGGLLSYASDLNDRFRRAAVYVDRILRGAKVSELPVQFPTKFELVVNLKTAKAIGLTIPVDFLQRADEVIE